MKRISLHIQLLVSLWTWLLAASLPRVCSGQEVACVDLVPDTTWTITKCAEVETQLYADYKAAQKLLRETCDEEAWNKVFDDYIAFTSKSYNIVEQLDKIIDYHLEVNREQNIEALCDTIGNSYEWDKNPYIELLRVCNVGLRYDGQGIFNLDIPFCYKQTLKLQSVFSHHCPKSILNAMIHANNMQVFEYFSFYDYDYYSKGIVNNYNQFTSIYNYLEEHKQKPLPTFFGVVYLQVLKAFLNPQLLMVGVVAQKDQELVMNDLRKSLVEIEPLENMNIRGIANLKIACRSALATVQNYDYSVLRNVIMPNDWTYHTEHSDAVARLRIAAYEKQTKALSIHQKSTVWLLKTYLGEVAPDVAVRQLDAYDAERKLQLETYDYAVECISSLFNRIFLLDISTLSEKKKHEKMLEYSKKIIANFEVMNRAKGYGAINAQPYATLPRLVKHLSSKERYAYELGMMKAMHTLDMGHSMVVDALCQVFLKYVIEKQPDLLVGLPQVPELKALSNKATRQQLMQFMHVAAMVHDLGAETLPNVYMGKFRPLTDEEVELEGHHTEKGLQFLMVDPSLNVYSDFVLGHHKWYNGKRGLPKWHDNTLSDYRFLVDLLTICDELEESTSVLYAGKKVKTFEASIQNMTSKRFTVYNPALVDMITQDDELASELKQILNEGRRKFYYMAVTGQ